MVTGSLILTAAGCGASYDTEENTVFVKRNGQVYETNVESYDEAYYSMEELEAFINEELSAYEGEGEVSLQNLSLEGNHAMLTVSYSDGDTYADFNKRTFYNGKVVQAQAAGYDFNVRFFAADGGTSDSTEAEADSSIPRDTVVEDPNLKVVILAEDVRVELPGRIIYYSENVTPEDKDTAYVTGYGEDTLTNGPAYIIYK